jgi:hypothetical protein
MKYLFACIEIESATVAWHEWIGERIAALENNR